jgi:hypothetical protein
MNSLNLAPFNNLKVLAQTTASNAATKKHTIKKEP